MRRPRYICDGRICLVFTAVRPACGNESACWKPYKYRNTGSGVAGAQDCRRYGYAPCENTRTKLLKGSSKDRSMEICWICRTKRSMEEKMKDKFYQLPQDKRERMIEAGYRVSAKNEYKRASMSAIADAAGISKQGIGNQ